MVIAGLERVLTDLLLISRLKVRFLPRSPHSPWCGEYSPNLLKTTRRLPTFRNGPKLSISTIMPWSPARVTTASTCGSRRVELLRVRMQLENFETKLGDARDLLHRSLAIIRMDCRDGSISGCFFVRAKWASLLVGISSRCPLKAGFGPVAK